MSFPSEFNRVTFGLPVETFRVDAYIALEERLAALQQGRAVAAEVGEYAVANPIHDGMLGPQVVQLGPGVFFSAGLSGGFNGGGHALGAGAQGVQVVVGLHFARQLLEALLQVARCGEGNDLLGVVRRPLAQGVHLVKLGERGLGVVVVAVEQGGGLVNLRGAADGRWGLVATEQAEQVVALVVVFLRSGCIQLGFDLFGAHALGHEVGDFLHLFVGVKHVEEGRGVAQVQGGLLVFCGQDLEDAQVALDFVGGGLGEKVDDLRLVLLAIAVHPAIALLEHHE